ncbi:uncharacterized protein LOC125947336 [Dermacentor silvarum]|uniref:uncharacterized protein LOC125947336 n=1 Tax=Dermacentor silvarum TaxID=543639 RepID=UPI0021014DF7|nr:uncharacterized protein LOC125947336 [Dermacentor silvarum]
MIIVLIPLLTGALFPFTVLARGGPRELHRETPDAFEAFARFPHVVAIFNWNDDAFFECLEGKQISFDPEAKKTTYIFMYKGHHGEDKKNVAYHISQGPAINEVIYYLDDECMLFVSKQAADNVPQECIEQYNDICGIAFSVYARDLCPDDEEDY